MALIILDRDGVINHDSDHYIKSVEEWIPIHGSIKAMARLKQAGHILAIATNQSGLGRGYYDEAELQAMHNKMNSLLWQHKSQVDFISYCPHRPNEGCLCRKPKPGMLLQILHRFQTSVKDAVFVGDSYSDFQAAQVIGLAFVLVKTGKGKREMARHVDLVRNVKIFDSLDIWSKNFVSQCL